MKRSIEVLLAAVLSGFVAFQIGSCGKDKADDARDVAYKLANHYRWQRDSLALAQGQTDTITEHVIGQDRKLLAERDSLRAVLTYADSVLADSTATLADLRVTLRVTIRRVHDYQSQVDSLSAQARELVAAHALERLATQRTLTLADSAITAWRSVADAERRKGWRRFTQGAFVGAGVALIGVLVL